MCFLMRHSPFFLQNGWAWVKWSRRCMDRLLLDKCAKKIIVWIPTSAALASWSNGEIKPSRIQICLLRSISIPGYLQSKLSPDWNSSGTNTIRKVTCRSLTVGYITMHLWCFCHKNMHIPLLTVAPFFFPSCPPFIHQKIFATSWISPQTGIHIGNVAEANPRKSKMMEA